MQNISILFSHGIHGDFLTKKLLTYTTGMLYVTIFTTLWRHDDVIVSQWRHFYPRMNLRDATKIINKADTGITLNKSEQKLAELMLHAPSDKKFNSYVERPTLSDILRNRASDFHPQNGSAMIDINAIDSSQTALCQKDIEDSDLHHVLKVSTEGCLMSVEPRVVSWASYRGLCHERCT